MTAPAGAYSMSLTRRRDAVAGFALAVALAVAVAVVAAAATADAGRPHRCSGSSRERGREEVHHSLLPFCISSYVMYLRCLNFETE